MKFTSIVGHEDVRLRLIQSAKDQRVSHALLFLGPEGGGNLPLAVAFAQYLVCENPTESDSCGLCPGCKKMNKLVHPDVSFSFPVAPKDNIKEPRSVDFIAQFRNAFLSNPYLNYNQWMESLSLDNKQGVISIHESADIVSRLTLKSVEAPYKIVIIWLPERLNSHAANKLLKIIEEPPDNTLFFLAAENYELLLTTIVSRTQLIKVNRINDEEMTNVLVNTHEVDKSVARRVTHLADGNYNEAQLLIGKDETEADMNQKFLEWMRYCLRLNVKGINQMSQDFGGESREYQKNFLRHALSLTRECLLINYGDHSLVRIDGQDLEDIKRFAPFVNANNIHSFSEELNKAHFHLERNANSKLLFVDLSFCMHKHLSDSK